MGRITGAFGVKGWVRVQPYTGAPAGLLAYERWWVEHEGGWAQRRIEKAQLQGTAIAAKFAGCEHRDAAAAYKGREVGVAREELPAAAENEFYWVDLIGLRVVNAAGEDLGAVDRVLETGANDVLVVQGDRERLIPFIEQVVLEVDLAANVIRVDWGSDF